MRRLTTLLLGIVFSRLSAQSALPSADSALAAGQPWRATQVLAPLLGDPRTRTPEVVLLAARAAAAWEGWPTVRRLLEHEIWLDTKFDRLGRRRLPRPTSQSFAIPRRWWTPLPQSGPAVRAMTTSRPSDSCCSPGRMIVSISLIPQR